MNKFNMQTLVNYFAFQNNIPSDVVNAIDELKAELNQDVRKRTAKKTYTWDKLMEMKIDFNLVYRNATCCNCPDRPYTFWEAIREEFAGKDNSVYFNITEEIREQVADDFRNYLIERNLSLEGMFDDEE